MKRLHTNLYTIPSVCKAMDLLNIILEAKGHTSARELASRLGLPKSTCYRILQSLILKDWIRPLANGDHELSFSLLPLLQPLWPVNELVQTVKPIIHTLSKRLQFTTKVAIRQGDYAVTVASCESPGATSISVRPGAAFHLAYGATGAVLLSKMAPNEIQRIIDLAPVDCWAYQKPHDVFQRIDELRSKGWCADMGTHHPSFHTVSVPVFSEPDTVRAAITILGYPNELTSSKFEKMGQTLADMAREAETN